jgi:GntR family transcriptional regulator
MLTGALRPDGPEPLYEQLMTQISDGIAAGRWPAGTLLPGVRVLANELVINANTVARAYQELERLGILSARRGLGMEVTADAGAVCLTRQLTRVASQIQSAVRAARAAGLDPASIRELVEAELTSKAKAKP